MKPSDIIARVADMFGVKSGELCGDGRTKDLVPARQIACWLAMRHYGYSSSVFGASINRDHSTVSVSALRVDSDPELRALAENALGVLRKWWRADRLADVLAERRKPKPREERTWEARVNSFEMDPADPALLGIATDTDELARRKAMHEHRW